MKTYIRAVDITDDFVPRLKQSVNYLFKHTCDKYGLDLNKIKLEKIKLLYNSIVVYFRYENNLLYIYLNIPSDVGDDYIIDENLWVNYMINGVDDYYSNQLKKLIEQSAQFSTYRDNIISAYNSIIEILNNSELLEYELRIFTNYDKNGVIVSGLDKLNELLDNAVLKRDSFVTFEAYPIRINYYSNRFSLTSEDCVIITDNKNNNSIQIQKWLVGNIVTVFHYSNRFDTSAFKSKVKCYEDTFKEYLARLININAYNKQITEFIAKVKKAIPGIEIDYDADYNNSKAPAFYYQISYPELFGALDREIEDIFIDDLDKVVRNLKATVSRYKKSK